MEQRSCFLHGDYTGHDACQSCKNREAETLGRNEIAFNAGFDSAVRSILRQDALKAVKFTHPQYTRDRRTKFEEWTTALKKETT